MTYFLITQIISFVLIFSILILLCFFFVHNKLCEYANIDDNLEEGAELESKW